MATPKKQQVTSDLTKNQLSIYHDIYFMLNQGRLMSKYVPHKQKLKKQ